MVSGQHRPLLLLVIVTAGCASQLSIPKVSAPDLALDASLFPGPRPDPLPDAFLAVDPAMRSFVEQVRPRLRSSTRQVDALIDALFDEEGLEIEYSAASTHTAAETFRRKRGDCLSVTALFVALAREMGLQASFQDVFTRPVWRRGQNLFINERHVSALVRLSSYESVTVDFDTRASAYKVRTNPISDETALAQLYNNLAATAVQNGNRSRSYHLFRRAIQADPSLPFVWSNVGTLYSSIGHHQRAEQAYLYALNIDSGELSAMANLVNLYRRTGRPDLARRYLERVEKYQRRNPYYMQALAEDALERGDYERAEKYALRAIELKSDEQSFRALLRKVKERPMTSR